MAVTSMSQWLNALIGVFVTIIIFEGLLSLFKIGSETFLAVFKLVVYLLLVLAIYFIESKSSNFTTNIKDANDFLTILTFTLAGFEAIQSLIFLLKKFFSWKANITN
jgi:hypothetical protein